MAWRSGKATGGPVYWSNGDTFNGYALVQMCKPTSGGTQWPSMAMNHQYPLRTVPLSLIVGIVDGIYDNTVAVPYNADMTPPNSRYEAYFYETNNRFIAGPTSPFTVTAATFDLTAPTLTVPTAGAVTPPDS